MEKQVNTAAKTAAKTAKTANKKLENAMPTAATPAAAPAATPAAAATATPTPEQLVTLGLTAELYNSLPAATKAVLLKGLKPQRAPKAPVDPWSNSQLMVYGNDHSRVIAALSLLLRAGRKESEITQAELTKATLALQFVLKGWKETGRCAMAEASTRTAVGQSRLWREICDTEKLAKNCHRLELDDFEQRVFDFYCRYSFWPGEKEDSNKRFSPTAAALLMETWKEKTAQDPTWYPPEYAGTIDETPADDSDNDGNDDGEA